MANLRSAFLCLTIMMAVTPSLPAQREQLPPPARPESVERLLLLTKAEALHIQVLEQVLASYSELSPMAQMSSQFQDLLRKHAAWEVVKPDIMMAYTELLTEDEAQGLIAFYESPLGARFIELSPILTRKIAELGMARMRDSLLQMGFPLPPGARPASPPQ